MFDLCGGYHCLHDQVLQSYAENFADLLVAVLHGKNLQEAVEEYGIKLDFYRADDDNDGIIRLTSVFAYL